jgi:hypothetical protein
MRPGTTRHTSTEEAGMDCTCTSEDFSATATRTDGKRTLRVEGRCECPRTGYRLRLQPYNPGTVPQPDEVVLELVEESPDFGGTVISPTDVEPYETEIGDEADRVEIRGRGGADISLEIEETGGYS